MLWAVWMKEWFEDYWTCDLCEAWHGNRGLADWFKEEVQNHCWQLPESVRVEIMWKAVGLSKQECWP